MSGSASTPDFQIESLLHSYGEALAARRARETPARKAAAFDSRSLMAGFLAVFVFAPGCAAAAVFLLKADEPPPRIANNSAALPASKANRLPLSEWKARAPITTPVNAPDVTRDAAAAIADVSFLGPVAIRGRLDEVILAAVSTEAPADAETAPRPRRRPEARRARPATSVAAEIAVPEPAPPPPSLLEKLFALRTL